MKKIICPHCNKELQTAVMLGSALLRERYVIGHVGLLDHRGDLDMEYEEWQCGACQGALPEEIVDQIQSLDVEYENASE